jgi:predicted O-linked N-acetylglucosamine transferase (SPINDLY family)
MIPSWQERLLARLTYHYADIAPRIRFIPRQNRQGFLQLLAQAQVMLDPLHYGGTNTSYEGLAMGLPIVTMPTEYLKGRITTGCYRQMGLLDCVVNSPEAYIEQAVKLGTDTTYRAQIKAEILARCHGLYEDLAAVHEMTAFFKQAIERRYNEEKS